MRLPPRLALCLALIGAASMLYYHQRLFMPSVVAARTAQGLRNDYSFGNDFYQVWLTSREWLQHRSDPYSPEMTREIQIGLYGRPLDPPRPGDPVDLRIFPYPAFTDLLFWPAADFPFASCASGRWCLAAFDHCERAFVGCAPSNGSSARTGSRVILLLTLCSYPALEALLCRAVGITRGLSAGRRHGCAPAPAIPARRNPDGDHHDKTTSDRARGRLSFALERSRMAGTRPLLRRILFDSAASGRSVARGAASLDPFLDAHHPRLPSLHPASAGDEVLTSPLGPRWSAPATLVLTAASIVIAILLAWRNRAAAFGSFAFWVTLSSFALHHHHHHPSRAGGLRSPHSLPANPDCWRATEMNFAALDPRPRAAVGRRRLVLFWPWIAAFALIVLRPWLAPATFQFHRDFLAASFALRHRFPSRCSRCWRLAMRINLRRRIQQSA